MWVNILKPKKSVINAKSNIFQYVFSNKEIFLTKIINFNVYFTDLELFKFFANANQHICGAGVTNFVTI